MGLMSSKEPKIWQLRAGGETPEAQIAPSVQGLQGVVSGLPQHIFLRVESESQRMTKEPHFLPKPLRY